MASRKFSLDKLQINFCKEADLMVLPGVGKKIARSITRFREMRGNITPGNISDVPRLKVTEHLLKMVDFALNPYYLPETSEEEDNNIDDNLTSSKLKDPFNEKMVKFIDEKSKQMAPPSTEAKSEGQVRYNDVTPKVVPSRTHSDYLSPEEDPSTSYNRGRGNRKRYMMDRDYGESPDRYAPEGRSPGRYDHRRYSKRHGDRDFAPDKYVPEGHSPRRFDYRSRVGYNREREFETEDEDEDTWEFSRRTSHRFKPASLPKSLSYDGKSNWLAFYRKFDRYAEASGWSKDECLDALCWCLTGKAADFYALLTESEERLTYSRVIHRLEKRFGSKELPETSYARFQQALQGSEEDLEDWADRVLTLAHRAFKGLPEDHMTSQAIVKFCQGCHDKEAGQSACNFRPKTMDQAMDRIRWFQYTHQAMCRAGRSQKDRKVSAGSSDYERVSRAVIGGQRSTSGRAWQDEEDEVLTISSSKEDRRRTQGRDDPSDSSDRLKKLEENMTRLEKVVMSSLEKVATEVSKLTLRRNSRSPSPARQDRRCFFCGEEGHFKKDCSLYKEKLEKHVTFSEDLNQPGSDKKADLRPGH